jgi:hypothetical protein
LKEKHNKNDRAGIESKMATSSLTTHDTMMPMPAPTARCFWLIFYQAVKTLGISKPLIIITTSNEHQVKEVESYCTFRPGGMAAMMTIQCTCGDFRVPYSAMG